MASALYLLTNHIPTTERAREEIRARASDLLSEILRLRDGMRSPQSSGVAAALSTIRHLISLVRILTVAGYLSITNAETVVAALDDLANFLVTSQRSILSENITIHREELAGVPEPAEQPRTAPRIIKDTREMSVTTNTKFGKDSHGQSISIISTESMSVRVQNILDILRTGGSLGIKDIAANLPEYGEKTIQRELAALVGEGRVKRVGLKRWSRYSIAA